MTYQLIYDKSACIGAGECEAIAPNLWKVNNNGLAELKGATTDPKSGMLILQISDEQAREQEEVIGSCPVGCIKLEKI